VNGKGKPARLKPVNRELRESLLPFEREDFSLDYEIVPPEPPRYVREELNVCDLRGIVKSDGGIVAIKEYLEREGYGREAYLTTRLWIEMVMKAPFWFGPEKSLKNVLESFRIVR
jgi:hypothetical protein